VRDPLLNEALRRLATEAATRFAGLVAGGDQIPFDVAEQAGPDEAFFHSYVPLTGRYVREREAELRSLPGFEPAREAVADADVAAGYLEQRGEAVPGDPRERAARLLTVFVASLWDGCTEFSLDRERLDAAVAALDAEAGSVDEADILVVPIAGLRLPVPRLRLPHGVQIVRADAFEAPGEAKRSEGMGRAAWEPQFLAIAEQGDEPNSAAAALRQLRELVTVMRLFKPGGVGLGPHAFAPSGEGSWRRIATGAPAPRPGGYVLDEAEAAELAELASALEARPDPTGPLAWAVRRFELGCERETAPEGLSDQLLALRAVLDGQGPVGASLPMRAAALIADGSEDRLGVRERIEAALELERGLMSGASVDGAAELAGWIEESVRRILREAALGELGTDLNEAADESLIATGLDSGDAEIAIAIAGTSDEVADRPDQGSRGIGADADAGAAVPVREGSDPGMPGRAARRSDRPSQSDSSGGSEAAAFGSEQPPADETKPAPEPEPAGPATERLAPESVGKKSIGPSDQPTPTDQEDHDMDDDTRILEPVPAEDEIRITAKDWLEEVEVEERALEESTLDFPAVEGDVERRERIDTPRVRHLFPVPEDADWEVRELRYDHYERRRAGRAG
jgi:hypothetical protein